MTERELYDLCKATHITINSDGNIVVPKPISADMVEVLKKNKCEIVKALSGYCFSRNVYTGLELCNWKIVKASNICDVQYPPVTVFSGTAMEVDAWACENRNDPFFTDRYTSKYYFCTDK